MINRKLKTFALIDITWGFFSFILFETMCFISIFDKCKINTDNALLVILIVFCIMVIWFLFTQKKKLKKLIYTFLLLLISIIFLTFLINPFENCIKNAELIVFTLAGIPYLVLSTIAGIKLFYKEKYRVTLGWILSITSIIISGFGTTICTIFLSESKFNLPHRLLSKFLFLTVLILNITCLIYFILHLVVLVKYKKQK